MTGSQLTNGAGTIIRKSPFCDLQWDNSLGNQEMQKLQREKRRRGCQRGPEQRFHDYLLGVERNCSYTEGRWDVALSTPTTECFLPRCRVEYHLSIVQCLRKVLNLNLIKTQVLTPSIQVIEEEELAKCHHLETDKSEMRGVLHHKLSGVEAQFHTATCSLWSSLHLLKLDP